jgi:hypothetical protein
MRLGIIAALLAALVAATTASASTINRTDRTNAARACTALRASSSAAFKNQYATFGACTSAWARKAHADRMAATTACRAKHLTGKALSACVKAATGKKLAAQTATAKNAAKACQAELGSMGASAFEQKYAANHNLRNAFGKCVSGQVSNGGGGGSGTPASHYTVTIAALNGSDVSGSGTLLLNGNKLQVNLNLANLSASERSIAVRGLSTGQASCPTAAADTNGDGSISEAEGQAAYGSIMLGLDAATLSSSGWEATIASSLLPLQSRTIVVLGRSPEGISASTVPVACGVIAAK